MKRHEEVLREAKEYIKTKGVSQAAFAKLVGIGESTFSRWMGGTLDNTSSQDRIISTFLHKESERKAIKTANQIPYMSTNISKRIWGLLNYSALTRCIGVVYGDAGVGKTTTIREWAKSRADAIVIKADKVIGSRNKGLLKALARVLKTQNYGQSDDIYYAILSRLKQEDRVIIIDEAQHLSLSNIELLRDIYDDSETPVIFVGNERIYSKIAGDKTNDYAQIYSRIGAKEHVLTDDTTREDVQKICVGVDKEGCDYLYSIAQNSGGLRSAVIIYVNASNNGNTSLSGLKAIASYSGKNR